MNDPRRNVESSPSGYPLTIDRPCQDNFGRDIPAGTVLPYFGHVLGGMVKTVFDGRTCIIHPGATKELSQRGEAK